MECCDREMLPSMPGMLSGNYVITMECCEMEMTSSKWNVAGNDITMIECYEKLNLITICCVEIECEIVVMQCLENYCCMKVVVCIIYFLKH